MSKFLPWFGPRRGWSVSAVLTRRLSWYWDQVGGCVDVCGGDGDEDADGVLPCSSERCIVTSPSQGHCSWCPSRLPVPVWRLGKPLSFKKKHSLSLQAKLWKFHVMQEKKRKWRDVEENEAMTWFFQAGIEGSMLGTFSIQYNYWGIIIRLWWPANQV